MKAALLSPALVVVLACAMPQSASGQLKLNGKNIGQTFDHAKAKLRSQVQNNGQRFPQYRPAVQPPQYRPAVQPQYRPAVQTPQRRVRFRLPEQPQAKGKVGQVKPQWRPSRQVVNPPRQPRGILKQPGALRSGPAKRVTFADERPQALENQSRTAPKNVGKAGQLQKAAPSSRVSTVRSASKARSNAKALADVGKAAKTGKTVLKAAGGGLVAGAVLKDTTGIDPLELGIDAVGDVVNGTDNAKRKLDNVENAWNKSLTKQAVTDPAGAAKRVENDVKKTGKDIEKGVQDAGKAIGGLFK